MLFFVNVLMMLEDSKHKVVYAVHDKAGACYAEPYHRNHIFILQEGEYAVIYEKPILIVIYRVSKECPNYKTHNGNRLVPKVFKTELYLAESEI